MNELAELAGGRWEAFHGLAGCTLADADARLGPPLEEELVGGMFGGEPAQLRRYPPTTAAPYGVSCWVLGDAVVGIEMQEAVPGPDALAALGPAELVLGSELGPAWSQEAWASRGLVIHRRGDRIRVLFGLAPFDPVAWSSDPLRWWRIDRREA